MLKRDFIMSLVLFGVAFCAINKECFADAKAPLEQADVYLENGDYEQAEAIYKSVIKDSPGTNDALEAQKKLGVLYITWEKQPDAKDVLDGLLDGFSSNPAVTEAVWEVCETYFELDKYAEGSEFFQYFLDNRPKDKNSIWMQAGLVKVNIINEDYSRAETLLKEMLSEYSVDDALLADVLINIGSDYFYTEQYEKAHLLYTEAMNKGPDELDEMWAVMSLGMSNAALGNNAEADSLVKSLLTDFSDRPDVAEAVFSIAEAYLNSAKEYQKSAELFENIVQAWPDSKIAIFSQSNLVRANIALRDETNTQAAIEKLITDFGGHPDFSKAMIDIAQEYYDEALRLRADGLEDKAQSFLQTANNISQTIQNNFPDFVMSPDLYIWQGACYEQLGEYEKAIESYQKMADEYPDHDMTWHGLFMIGRNYEKLQEAQMDTDSDADAIIQTAYELLLEKYPNCKAAKAAQNWLNRHNSN